MSSTALTVIPAESTLETKPSAYETILPVLPTAALILAVNSGERDERGLLCAGKVDLTLSESDAQTHGDIARLMESSVSALLGMFVQNITDAVEQRPENFKGIPGDPVEYIFTSFLMQCVGNCDLTVPFLHHLLDMPGIRPLLAMLEMGAYSEPVEDRDLGDEDDAPESLRISEAG